MNEQRMKWRIEDVLSEKLAHIDVPFQVGGVWYGIQGEEGGPLGLYDADGNALGRYMWEVTVTRGAE